jgi:glycosyltransferase involved in cell wall biosynthesis
VALVYISNGNIPSTWAHTFQIMKMTEALSRLARGVSLMVAVDMVNYHLRRNRTDLWRWYGLRTRFDIRRVPIAWHQNPVHERDSNPRFCLVAPLLARLGRHRTVITRSPTVALRSLKLRMPTIFELHSVPKPKVLEAIAAIVRHPGLVGLVANTTAVAESLVAAGADEASVLVAPNGVDLDQFDADADRSDARRRLGLPDDAPIVMYCGHLYDYKGIADIIDSARRLSQIRFVLVGGRPEEVERWRQSAEGVTNLRFEGFVANQELPRYLAASDICLSTHSARHEAAAWTSPLKLYEYMAAGRPIVATDIPATRDLLRHGHNAVVIEADNAEALSAGIQHLLDRPALGVSLVRQARSEAEGFGWPARAESILGRFAPELLERRPGPGVA